MSAAMIEQSTERLFAAGVSHALLMRFEAGEFAQALWQRVADHGLALALATEAAGGIAATWADAYPILRGIGYWQVPLPLAETMIAGQLLSMAGMDVPAGPIALIEEDGPAPWALADSAAGLRLTGHPLRLTGHSLRLTGHPLRLTGRAQRVAWASACRWALLSLPPTAPSGAGRILLLDLHDAASVHITTHRNPASEPCDEVALHGAPVLAQAANPLPALHRPVRTLGAIASSVMMVGAMEWLLAQSVQYAQDRVQFGRPIGKNQAIQQQLALMAGDVAAARVAALVACADAPHVGATGCAATLFSAAVAKVRCGEAASRAAAIAHQVHGAIGFTQEHALHFATRRLWAWREAHGADAWWAPRLGEAAMQAGSAGFWPSLTDRHFASLNLRSAG